MSGRAIHARRSLHERVEKKILRPPSSFAAWKQFLPRRLGPRCALWLRFSLVARAAVLRR